MNDSWIEVEVSAKELEADGVVRLELVDREGGELPGFTAGAHIDVEVAPDLIRQYSLCNSPRERHRYVIGVLREPSSRGGSQAVHDSIQAGHTIRIRAPRNHFALDPTASRYILFAGGIGVTPILAMAEHLSDSGKPFELHYCVRTAARAAFVRRMTKSSFSAHVHLHFDDGLPEQRLEIRQALGSSDDDAHVYVCGPAPFIGYVLENARERGWPEARLHREFFAASTSTAASAEESFEVQLSSTGQILTVPADRSIVEVLGEAGVALEVSCEQGVCGTCLTRVLQGEPDHRDVYLTDAEHLRNDCMTVCCSRSKSARLVLDL
ncbi:vanillate O-demethylase ferredoxin subunit [Paraburkholderia sp. GAS206C]|uniref:PDR/VanB family oxidoreductase n=1 Tax=unclassified Paraburkholderia TaxID=2615204 RepID=UPI003D25CABC